MTTRAARWATVQVGRHGRAVSEVAADLGCDWHTVMDAVVSFGEPLIDDPARHGKVNAVGLDETLYVREGRYRRQLWSTQVVDVECGQLLDVLDGKEVNTCCAWFVKRTAFGFRRFEHYRIRALLYAGRPNWSLLDQLTPP